MTSFSLITPYFRENRNTIILGLACLMVVDFLQLCIPRVIKWAVDDLTLLQADTQQLGRYALWILLLSGCIGIFRYIWRRCLIGLSRRVEEGLRNRLLAHLQTLSAPYYDAVRSGDLMAHATNDIQNIRMATGMGMVALTDAVVLGSAAVGFMLYINVSLTLLVMLPMPLIIFGMRVFGRKMHQRYQRVQAAFADTTETVRESITGIRIVKAYTREELAFQRLTGASEAYVQQNMRLVRVTSFLFPMMVLFTNISLLMILYFGGRQTLALTITPGDFVAFINYLGLLTWPMMAMGWVTNLIQRGKASLDRLQQILQTAPEIVDSPSATAPAKPQGCIVLENIDFTYPQPLVRIPPPADAPSGQRASSAAAAHPTDRARVLHNLNLTLHSGQSLGITGPPGSGKSTLLALMGRLYDVSAGRILFDAQDLRQWPLAELRRQLVFLPQEPFLFAGTIRHNITFGDPAISEERLIQAARQALFYETIAQLPEGFETLVGERGVLLSGGQKQRLALARCLVRPAPLLLLDDPVSQVDVETGHAMMANLQVLPWRPTLMLVSHRLAALKAADVIVVLENGRIRERGSHADLLATEGYYARTWRLQELEEVWHAR